MIPWALCQPGNCASALYLILPGKLGSQLIGAVAVRAMAALAAQRFLFAGDRVAAVALSKRCRDGKQGGQG